MLPGTPTTLTMHITALLVAGLASLSRAAVLWDGRFNNLTAATDLNDWSWSNEVGPYQYYIHGSETVDKYISLSSANKNPADTASKQGAKFTLDSTAYWNGQNMRRESSTDHPIYSSISPSLPPPPPG